MSDMGMCLKEAWLAWERGKYADHPNGGELLITEQLALCLCLFICVNSPNITGSADCSCSCEAKGGFSWDAHCKDKSEFPQVCSPCSMPRNTCFVASMLCLRTERSGRICKHEKDPRRLSRFVLISAPSPLSSLSQASSALPWPPISSS